jgi:hypothetical protein
MPHLGHIDGYTSEERAMDGPPKGLWESLSHEERQLFCKNRGKMAAIMPRPSDSVRVYSEALSSVAELCNGMKRMCVFVL